VAVVSCALVACAVVAPAVPPNSHLSLPLAWSESGTGSVTPLAAWWRRFEDPLLVALIDDALRANATVRGAVAALAQSRALFDVQTAGLAPSLNGSASAQRSRNRAAGSSNVFNAGFDASWEPDVFGGRRAGVSAAGADTLASAASLGDAQVSVAAELAVNYMQLRGLQARLAIAQASLQSQEETLQIAQWRAQAGLLTALEVEQARCSRRCGSPLRRLKAASRY
jgi:multidrug efflux system outer membrane protein